jgi:hypothetical protein
MRNCAGTVAIRTSVQIFIPMTVLGAAMLFRVIWETDIDAQGPKEAVQEARVAAIVLNGEGDHDGYGPN